MTDTIETFSLKGARNEFDFTQQQIADKLGVSRAQYIAWEKGEVIPKSMVVYALAYIYGVNADLLRGRKKFKINFTFSVVEGGRNERITT